MAPWSFVSIPITNATYGVLYSYDANASGTSVVYAMTTNAAFLTINGVWGMASGTPDGVRDYIVNITATNSYGHATQSYYLHVLPGSADPSGNGSGANEQGPSSIGSAGQAAKSSSGSTGTMLILLIVPLAVVLCFLLVMRERRRR